MCASSSPTGPSKRVGSDEVWDKAEAALKRAVEAAGLSYELNPGEGAFYGPKLEYVLRDAIGRDWQCGTIQVDLNLPGRLGAFYIAPDGEKTVPVMIHRAMFGSLERFTGILIEHYAGHLPLWLAPVQAVVATIVSDADDYAGEVLEALKQSRLARRGRSPQREDQLQSARAFARQGAGAAGGRQARGRGEDGVGAAARQPGAAGDEPRCGGRRAGGRGRAARSRREAAPAKAA